MGEEYLAGSVHPFQQVPIRFIAAFVAETYQRQRNRSAQLEPIVSSNHRSQFLRPGDMVPNARSQTFPAVVAHHKPELEGAEAATQRNTVIHEIHNARIFGGTQELGDQREGALEDFRLTGVEHAQVDRDAHPLVRIHHQRIGAFGAGEHVAKLLRQRCRPAIGRVHVHP